MRYFYRIVIYVAMLLSHYAGHANGLLNKRMSLFVTKKSLGETLKLISQRGNFYFSYNSYTVNEHSLVTVNAKDKTVRQILSFLFDDSYEFKESGSHIIIQYTEGAIWYATGYVKDIGSNNAIPFATVYDRRQFASTMTNESGYFRLKLKDRNTPATLYVSKSWYNDTTVTIDGNYNKDLSIGIAPQNFMLDSFVVSSRNVERNWFGRFFLSSKQRMQSVNLSKYFVDKPYQGSVIPGVGTHGRMGAQVVNKFSFNLLGGYTAGVNGVEIGGVFNIVKKDVRYVQIGGVFNIVGGNVKGLQIGGVYNHVMKASQAWQIAGVSNLVNDDLKGLQVAGVYNHTWGNTKGAAISGCVNLSKGNVDGVQLSGVTNYANKDIEGVQATGVANIVLGNTDGVQVSGVVNMAAKEMKGTQVAVINYAGHLKGVQAGLINLADTSSGISVGLISFVRKGYHKLHLSTDEVTNLCASGKIGNKKLYNIVKAGLNVGSFQKAALFGYGFGSEVTLYKHFSVSPEITGSYLYLGDGSNANWLCRFNLNVNYNLNKWFSINAGPAYNFYYSNQASFLPEWKSDVPNNGILSSHPSSNWHYWLGWHAGISIF